MTTTGGGGDEELGRGGRLRWAGRAAQTRAGRAGNCTQTKLALRIVVVVVALVVAVVAVAVVQKQKSGRGALAPSTESNVGIANMVGIAGIAVGIAGFRCPML